MELELKHLAPYLPYNLMIRGNTNGEIAELSCCTETSVNITTCGFQYGMWADIFDIKPILRPLYDLKKEIDLELEGLFIICGERFKYWEDVCLESINYEQFSWFLKNHYDVFGLIEKGLAIDINTLDQ
jgi:hypothetical protein